jgi:hypothetical protein
LDPLTSVLGATQGDKDRAKPLAIERPCAIEADADAPAAELAYESLVTRKADRRQTRGQNSTETSQPSLK